MHVTLPRSEFNNCHFINCGMTADAMKLRGLLDYFVAWNSQCQDICTYEYVCACRARHFASAAYTSFDTGVVPLIVWVTKRKFMMNL
jgi:hypothetical protein